jgi:hypothetical protein
MNQPVKMVAIPGSFGKKGAKKCKMRTLQLRLQTISNCCNISVSEPLDTADEKGMVKWNRRLTDISPLTQLI